MKPPLKDESSITGSPARDLVLFTLIACLIVITSFRLRVYYQVSVFQVHVTQISQDGSRKVLPTPKYFQRIGSSAHRPDVVLEKAKYQIRKYMRESAPFEDVAPGSSLEWDIRYAFNSTKLDQKFVMSFGPDGLEKKSGHE